VNSRAESTKEQLPTPSYSLPAAGTHFACELAQSGKYVVSVSWMRANHYFDTSRKGCLELIHRTEERLCTGV
jgi:hypothetical protein